MIDLVIIGIMNDIAKNLGALYVRWAWNNIEEKILIENALEVYQGNRYKELGLIIFDFTFYKV